MSRSSSFIILTGFFTASAVIVGCMTPPEDSEYTATQVERLSKLNYYSVKPAEFVQCASGSNSNCAGGKNTLSASSVHHCALIYSGGVTAVIPTQVLQDYIPSPCTGSSCTTWTLTQTMIDNSIACSFGPSGGPPGERLCSVGGSANGSQSGAGYCLSTNLSGTVLKLFGGGPQGVDNYIGTVGGTTGFAYYNPWTSSQEGNEPAPTFVGNTGWTGTGAWFNEVGWQGPGPWGQAWTGGEAW